METYDVVAIGGGIAGSIAARLAAENRLSTLLIERAQTPRDKPCSGIQFGYFEKLIGRPIPEDKLCSNELFNMNIITPGDKTYQGKMKVLNFWRSTFDRWLNELAVEEGAVFQDKTRLVSFEDSDGGYQLSLQSGSESREVFTRYLIAADGMYSRRMKKLRPGDFLEKAPGGAMNYYCTGEGDLDPHALYMVNIKEYAPIMFAWIYKKDDLWVIGTGAEHDLKDCADRFYAYVCDKYSFEGEIVPKEGFASPLKFGVYLGEGNALLCGVAMDNAALSARFAVQAILDAERTGSKAITHYTQKMEPMKRQMEANEIKRQKKFVSDDSLAASFSPKQVLIDGLKMMAANTANKYLPPEKIFTFPF